MSNNVNIDGKDYPVGLLSDAAKNHLLNLQLVDKKIIEAQQELAILQTARNAYAAELKKELPGDELSL